MGLNMTTFDNVSSLDMSETTPKRIFRALRVFLFEDYEVMDYMHIENNDVFSIHQNKCYLCTKKNYVFIKILTR